MTITELVEKAHKNATDKGFYESDMLTITTLKILKKNNLIDENTNKLINTNFINSMISSKLMLIVSELGEALKALRNRNFVKLGETCPYHLGHEALEQSNIFADYIKDTFEDEIADVFIRLFDLCGFMQIDIERHIKLKMNYNKSRPKLHGKEF